MKRVGCELKGILRGTTASVSLLRDAILCSSDSFVIDVRDEATGFDLRARLCSRLSLSVETVWLLLSDPWESLREIRFLDNSLPVAGQLRHDCNLFVVTKRAPLH
jgi:hypothetical protein